MRNSRGKHHNVDPSIESEIKWLESLAGVERVIPGIIEPCHHTLTPGTLKLRGDEPTGFRLYAYQDGGVRECFVVVSPIGERDALRRHIEERYQDFLESRFRNGQAQKEGEQVEPAAISIAPVVLCDQRRAHRETLAEMYALAVEGKISHDSIWVPDLQKVQDRSHWPLDDSKHNSSGSELFALGVIKPNWTRAENDVRVLEGFFEVVIGDIRGEDLVVYCNNKGKPVHYGLHQADGLVHSKWRESHVFSHPLDLIPTHFGSSARFFRKVER
ncbi:MAG: hypothetical protein KDD64_07855 [Bdellovibrionales bacterium]|nr:hypothetical protein [Bdellovibrionales bacterium]